VAAVCFGCSAALVWCSFSNLQCRRAWACFGALPSEAHALPLREARRLSPRPGPRRRPRATGSGLPPRAPRTRGPAHPRRHIDRSQRAHFGQARGIILGTFWTGIGREGLLVSSPFAGGTNWPRRLTPIDQLTAIDRARQQSVQAQVQGKIALATTPARSATSNAQPSPCQGGCRGFKSLHPLFEPPPSAPDGGGSLWLKPTGTRRQAAMHAPLPRPARVPLPLPRLSRLGGKPSPPFRQASASRPQAASVQGALPGP
jgi:hypothetical protein